MRKRSWNKSDLVHAVRTARSIRQVLMILGLREAGGNYSQIRKYIVEFDIDTSHFKGKAWNKGLSHEFVPRIDLSEILVQNSSYQTSKLKKRLFRAKLKPQQCEECGWAEISVDGRLPLELDHVNGNSRDHRLENLRVLCPNCHSLKPTHRGANRGKGRK